MLSAYRTRFCSGEAEAVDVEGGPNRTTSPRGGEEAEEPSAFLAFAAPNALSITVPTSTNEETAAALRPIFASHSAAPAC